MVAVVDCGDHWWLKGLTSDCVATSEFMTYDVLHSKIYSDVQSGHVITSRDCLCRGHSRRFSIYLSVPLRCDILPYLGFDFGDLEREVDAGGGSWDGLTACRDRPADAEAVADVKLVLLFTQVVDAVLPAVLVVPRLAGKVNHHIL